MLFQITYDVGDGIFSSTLDDDVQMIRHHHESVQFESLAKPHAIQAVDDQAFYYVILENMLALDGAGGDEI
jgi:hypothetical protein